MAGYAGMDVLGCVIVGTITSVGGGSIRDIMIGSTPVFWMIEVEHLWISVIASFCSFFTASLLSEEFIPTRSKIFSIFEALGVSAFCVIGAQKGLRMGFQPFICLILGVITASFGGVIRDVLCQKPPRILHSNAEIYASTAFSGASAYIILRRLRFSSVVRIVGGFLTAFSLRSAAMIFDIRLPTWAESPQI
mmetsp:Transcript_612/g.832  ORF Transcript_612/g.832 Transcript_612/m.832 type:complete len:192 (+) Transcript_612:243-818(+)